ncbi:MAG: glycosyltransferase family 4 protein [Bdellovibrionales bacterium]
MKILHVCETVIGGTGTYLNELIPLLQRDLGDANVRLVAPLEHLFQTPSIPHSTISLFHRPSRLRGLPFLCAAFLKEIRTFKPDIVHAHSSFAGVIARLIAPFFGIPVIYCPHGWATDRQQSGLSLTLTSCTERWLAKISSKIIAISAYERQRGIDLGIPADKIITIHNGLHEQAPAHEPIGWHDERLKVLFVGRLDKQKGADILLEATADLQSKVCVSIIGDSVVGHGAALKIGPHVKAHGWLNRSAVCAFMADCDVVVVPSRWEGFGLVALEAMRLGKPVIASRVGGLTELVIDGKTGFLVAPEKAQDLAKLLQKTDKTTLAEMGKAGHDHFIKNFTAERMAHAVIDVYSHAAKQ